MITKISNAQDALNALSENFTMLTEGKRKPDFAREVNNTVGKMISLAKTQVVEKIRIGDKEPIPWLAVDEPVEVNKLIEAQKARDKKPYEFIKA